MNPITLGNVYDERFGQSFGGNVWDTTSIAPTLKSSGSRGQDYIFVEVHNMADIKVIGEMDNSDGSMEIANRVYDSEGVSPCLNAHASDTVPKILETDTAKLIIAGKMDNSQDHTYDSINIIYDTRGLAPTLTSGRGGNVDPKIIERNPNAKHQQDLVQDEQGICRTIAAGTHGSAPHLLKTVVAMRGRDVENPTKRAKQNPDNKFQQRLEINPENISNTLTCVQKDNLVLEEKENSWWFDQNVYTEDSTLRSLKAGGGSGNIPKVVEPIMVQKVGDRDKDNFSTQTEYSNCIPANPMSDREQMVVEPITTNGERKEVANTILAGYHRTNMTGFNNDNAVLEERSGLQMDTEHKYGIRKLTPRECFRLMGVKDEDYDKLTVSNSQRYKQAGNSIVVDVLMGIFENMFVNECQSNALF